MVELAAAEQAFIKKQQRIKELTEALEKIVDADPWGVAKGIAKAALGGNE
jgi:hypothetical protein